MAWMWEKDSCTIVSGKREGESQLGRRKRRWNVDIKIVSKKWDGRACTGSICVRIRASDGLL
jgi:hypothetical protein